MRAITRRSPARGADVDSAPAQQALKLGFLLHDTARLRRLAHDAVLRPVGFTTAQASLMRHLSQQDGQTQSALADALDLGKVALGEMVERLALAGFVRRAGDAADRRTKRVFLTAAGRLEIDTLRAIALDLNEEIYAGLRAADIDQAARILGIVKQNLLRLTRG